MKTHSPRKALLPFWSVDPNPSYFPKVRRHGVLSLQFHHAYIWGLASCVAAAAGAGPYSFSPAGSLSMATLLSAVLGAGVLIGALLAVVQGLMLVAFLVPKAWRGKDLEPRVEVLPTLTLLSVLVLVMRHSA